MFIDLVGSTTLSQQLDPEDYHARVRAYQTACGQIITRYDGHIAQYLGDGMLVYFGYPAAHEDDAGRAVRSGLEIVAAVGQLHVTPPLQIRIGIHTGPVVVAEIGTGARTEQLALGETPNVAARLQGIAEPNMIVLSGTTQRLVAGLFDYQDLGAQTVKGLTTPWRVYQVLGESTVQHRLDIVLPTGLTPLVGREEELALLQRRWEQVKDREGQVVLLSGEAGHWQITPGAGTARPGRTGQGHASNFAARPIIRTVPCIRSSSTCNACCTGKKKIRSRSDHQTPSDTRSVPFSSSRHARFVCRSAFATLSCRCTATQSQSPTAETEDRRRP